jgi:hypothetical protein
MWTSRMGERDLVLQCLGMCVAIYTGCGIAMVTGLFLLSSVRSSTRGLESSLEIACCFLQQFENTLNFCQYWVSHTKGMMPPNIDCCLFALWWTHQYCLDSDRLPQLLWTASFNCTTFSAQCVISATVAVTFTKCGHSLSALALQSCSKYFYLICLNMLNVHTVHCLTG